MKVVSSEGKELKAFMKLTMPSWSPDGNQLLCKNYRDSPTYPNDVDVLNIASGKIEKTLWHSKYCLQQPRFSPDGHWIVFLAQDNKDLRRSPVYLAPYERGVIPGEQDWLEVTDGKGWEDMPRWSPDGNLVYFFSDHDGSRCLYARRLNRETKRPYGDWIEVHHVHSARLSLLNVGLEHQNMSVAEDKIVFTMGELSGNIWMAELKEEY